MCDKVVSNKQNLVRHVRVVHSETTKKYFKHIKKDGRFACNICGKSYSHSHNLKVHYAQTHSKKEIVEHKVPIEPIIHFAHKKALAVQESAGFIKEREEEKRNYFPLLTEEVT